jgi:transposase-like protein
MMQERGVGVDHSAMNRWVLKYAPELEEEFRKRKKTVGSSWRVDETDVKASKRFFKKSIQSSGVPEKITIDKSGANKAAAASFNVVQRKRTRPMLGFNSFRSATKTIAGIEIMHMFHVHDRTKFLHARVCGAEHCSGFT